MTKEDGDVQKILDAVDAARVFTGNFNDQLAQGYNDLVRLKFNELINEYPRLDKTVLMSMAMKRAGRIDPVGKEAHTKLVSITRSLLQKD